METIIEFLLMLFWDTLKTLLLQALIDWFKKWWDARQNNLQPV